MRESVSELRERRKGEMREEEGQKATQQHNSNTTTATMVTKQ
jgi:hypothetical protein